MELYRVRVIKWTYIFVYRFMLVLDDGPWDEYGPGLLLGGDRDNCVCTGMFG